MISVAWHARLVSRLQIEGLSLGDGVGLSALGVEEGLDVLEVRHLLVSLKCLLVHVGLVDDELVFGLPEHVEADASRLCASALDVSLHERQVLLDRAFFELEMDDLDHGRLRLVNLLVGMECSLRPRRIEALVGVLVVRVAERLVVVGVADAVVVEVRAIEGGVVALLLDIHSAVELAHIYGMACQIVVDADDLSDIVVFPDAG